MQRFCPPRVSVYQYPSENQNDATQLPTNYHVSVYQYPSENQNTPKTKAPTGGVSVYQYPSENQNDDGRAVRVVAVSVYQYPSENQNHGRHIYAGSRYQFINIHQRTKTQSNGGAEPLKYQFINIHQRTKTYKRCCRYFSRISLSISIREPKPAVR